MNFFLKNINSKYIEMLKTDTQGNDLNVLKSAGNFIKKIAFVQSEYWALEDYEGEKNKLDARNEIIEYMKKKISIVIITLMLIYFSLIKN